MHMRMTVACLILIAAALLGGCDSLRFAPSEQQKQNAWLHSRTAALAAEAARAQAAPAQVQDLTRLSEVQSAAFAAYYGPPRERPAADTPAQVLASANWQLAAAAGKEAAQRPEARAAASSALDIGIGALALFGGVLGTRAAGFVRDLRAKAGALQDMVAVHDQLKEEQPKQAAALSVVEANQSPATRQVVAGVRAAAAARNGTA